MQLFLMRHGESIGSILNCYVGAADFGLSDLGKEQAKQIGSIVTGLGIQAVFASPLKRSLDTAVIVRQFLGHACALEIIDDLKERNSYGILSGVEKKLAGIIFKDILNNLETTPEFTRKHIPGSEPFEVFINRVRLCFQTIVGRCAGKKYESVLIIGHGKFMETLLIDVLNVCQAFDYTFGKTFRLEFEDQIVDFGKIEF